MRFGEVAKTIQRDKTQGTKYDQGIKVVILEPTDEEGHKDDSQFSNWYAHPETQWSYDGGVDFGGVGHQNVSKYGDTEFDNLDDELLILATIANKTNKPFW